MQYNNYGNEYILCVRVNRPPVLVMCPNHEVVVFKTRTVNATYLGLIAIITNFIIAPPVTPVSTVSESFYNPSSSYAPPISSYFLS